MKFTLLVLFIVVLIVYFTCPECLSCLYAKAKGAIVGGATGVASGLGEEAFTSPWETTGRGLAPYMLGTNARDHVNMACGSASTQYYTPQCATASCSPCTWGVYSPVSN